MKREQVEKLFPLINSKVTGHRPSWVLGHCPLAPWNHETGKDEHPSFGIKYHESKKSICKCFSCGYGGTLSDLVYDLGIKVHKYPVSGYKMIEALQSIANEFSESELDFSDVPDYEDKSQSNSIVDLPFPESWLASFQNVEYFKVAVNYLLNRGLDSKTIKELDVRYDTTQQRVCFPYRNFKGELMGVQGRDIKKDSTLRYLQYGYYSRYNSHVWMGENLVDLDKPVVLVEGPIDYAKVFEQYPNVLASFTTGLSVVKMKRVVDASSIITFYDYGSGGNSARKLLSKSLGKVPLTHIIPTEEEGDAGAMDKNSIRSYLQPHVKLLPIKA